ncbi:N-acetylmuramidase domain-containing protein [Paraglaciecola hydrolytica]|uniref:Peptide-binding protein n=1 Tax=Paraglaciecola hydrolytica TaxID=1799789 RepID=A0A136A4S8_9ALTE|nr:N-acetylmuramidase domain-containing protein [Paraglaciecola hydrolytica]KXI30224.1 peptide-binding protein [Paraglaciecola hydrolytica]
MLGAVSTQVLNVRSLPQSTSLIIGQLTEGMVVCGDGPHHGWLQISYADTFGFVSTHYLQPVNDLARLSGTVTATTLNIRQSPSVSAKTLASLALGASVKTLAVVNDWLEIEFNGKSAYVMAKFIDLVYVTSGYYALVNVTALNVRSAPYVTASLFGQLSLDSRVWVEGKQLDWSQIRFNGNRGYVKSEYLHIDSQAAPQVTSIPSALDEQTEAERIPIVEHGQTLARLTPKTILTISGSSEQRNAAATWNRWGALLQDLSDKKQLDVACALAVLCVESSGKGFEQNNSDKMIIRFENHKFWTFWGKNNAQQFRQHFQYNNDKVWTEHQWRSEPLGEWQSFHGNQSAEWQVFEFACQLDSKAAMLSISMGAPQIMGFHFERIGYQSVEEMFKAFSTSIQGQINGLFDFFSPTMLRYLQEMAFTDFAGMYNGKGQKQLYGNKIQQHYTAFKKLMPNQVD